MNECRESSVQVVAKGEMRDELANGGLTSRVELRFEG
jgi:hypothetical protein